MKKSSKTWHAGTLAKHHAHWPALIILAKNHTTIDLFITVGKLR